MNPEHIPSINQVNAYLQKRDQGHLCQDVIDCNPWPAEALLMEDLRIIEEERGADSEREQVRTLLRAVSWFTYPPLDENELLAWLNKTNEQLSQWSIMKLLASSWEEIILSLEGEKSGPDLETACLQMDRIFLLVWQELNRFRKQHDFAWKKLGESTLPTDLQLQKDLVQLIRPIRDLIYFRRHFSGWLKPSSTAR